MITASLKIGQYYTVWHDVPGVVSPVQVFADWADEIGLDEAVEVAIEAQQEDAAQRARVEAVEQIIAQALNPEAAIQANKDAVKIALASTVERAFFTERDSIKISAIGYIKTHPACTLDEIQAAMAGAGHIIDLAGFLDLYVSHNFAVGRTDAATWESFRDFIYQTPVEVLMEVGD